MSEILRTTEKEKENERTNQTKMENSVDDYNRL